MVQAFGLSWFAILYDGLRRADKKDKKVPGVALDKAGLGATMPTSKAMEVAGHGQT